MTSIGPAPVTGGPASDDNVPQAELQHHGVDRRPRESTLRVSLSESESAVRRPITGSPWIVERRRAGSLQLLAILGSSGSRQLMHLGTGPAQYTLWYIFYNYIADVN